MKNKAEIIKELKRVERRRNKEYNAYDEGYWEALKWVLEEDKDVDRS